MATPATVVNVTDATFRDAVIEESRRRPVVVDFWAGWCQPCRIIGPVLERLADEHQGDFLLAKLDVDVNPQTSMAFRIQSIPAVKAFKDGAVVNEFVGAVPEPVIRQFLDTVVPSEADRLVRQGLEADRDGRTAEAERLYRRALDVQPSHEGALLGRGRLAAQRGDVEEARRLVEPLRPNEEAERLLAAIDVSEWAAPGANGDSPMAKGQRAAAEGRWEDALAEFLQEVRAGGEGTGAAREAMLKVFSVLGEDDRLTPEYRRKLAAALF
ncbi:MAG: tetratricopeptide repeat protein [Actinomycetota bacterium]|nr:tetratricopeptide repeat protein [Actinomycetota bacterium]